MTERSARWVKYWAYRTFRGITLGHTDVQRSTPWCQQMGVVSRELIRRTLSWMYSVCIKCMYRRIGLWTLYLIISLYLSRSLFLKFWYTLIIICSNYAPDNEYSMHHLYMQDHIWISNDIFGVLFTASVYIKFMCTAVLKYTFQNIIVWILHFNLWTYALSLTASYKWGKV